MTNIDYDPATGLPKLPPKYRWRVTDTDSWGIWQVKMQYLLWGWLPITVEHLGTQRPPTADHVRYFAELTLGEWERNRHRYAVNPYRGNYPPKRLEDK